MSAFHQNRGGESLFPAQVHPVNVIQIFDKDEELPAPPEGLTFGDSVGESPYGFKVVQEGGKAKWVMATREDVISAEARRNGVKDSEVKLSEGCRSTGPGKCAIAHCYGTVWCARAYDPVHRVYYCCCCG
jgi:hypothetical protein